MTRGEATERESRILKWLGERSSNYVISKLQKAITYPLQVSREIGGLLVAASVLPPHAYLIIVQASRYEPQMLQQQPKTRRTCSRSDFAN